MYSWRIGEESNNFLNGNNDLDSAIHLKKLVYSIGEVILLSGLILTPKQKLLSYTMDNIILSLILH